MSSTDTANRLSCGRPSSPGPLPRGWGVQPGSAWLRPPHASSAARTGSCRAISTAAGTFSESPYFQPGINLPRPLFPCYFQILSPLWRCQGPSAPLPSCPSGWFLASLQRTARPPLLPVGNVLGPASQACVSLRLVPTARRAVRPTYTGRPGRAPAIPQGRAPALTPPGSFPGFCPPVVLSLKLPGTVSHHAISPLLVSASHSSLQSPLVLSPQLDRRLLHGAAPELAF